MFKISKTSIALAALVCVCSQDAWAQQDSGSTPAPAKETPSASDAAPSAPDLPTPVTPVAPVTAPAPNVGPSAQQPATKPLVGGAATLPEVKIIQEQQNATKPVEIVEPKPKKKLPVVQTEPDDESTPTLRPKPKKQTTSKPKSLSKPAPPTQPVPQAEVEPAPVEAQTANAPYYGAQGGESAAARAATGPASPSDPTKGVVPDDLSKFSSAASRVNAARLDEIQPRTTNEIFHTVPGVHVINDDGLARHGGIGMRGSPPRRSRKILTMEDGQPINMSSWMDPSVHYQPPVDRIESVDVLRGTVIAYGPNNNHGVINYRNLSPFGPNESEVSFSIGSVSHKSLDEDAQSASPYGINNMRHVHTRQTLGNFGAVLSYSGAEADGVWDAERLRYNDFYGALGWKGEDQDFQVSAVYFRQRDNYDEANLTGEAAGEAEHEFFNEVGHCKIGVGLSCFNPGARFNTYNADVLKLQAVHNYYLDSDTTITSRLYGFDHRRDRYQNFGGSDPSEFAGSTLETEIEDDEVFVPEGTMLGRMRTYKQLGAEVRGEWANRPFIAGLSQDIQAGVRYEFNNFSNRNFLGTQGQILTDGDETGTTVFQTDTDANAFSASLQTSIHITKDFSVTPGLRVDHFRISRLVSASTVEEGEAEETAPCPDDPTQPCEVLEGFRGDDISEAFSKTHVLPGVSVAYSGLFRSTVYGGYHRGLTMSVLRESNARFPPPGDELGDNFQIGLRSSAIRGLTFDVAGFHHRIQDFQIKGSSTDGSGNNVYATVDEVHVNGVELAGRIDTNAYTGSAFNLFFEGNYTLSDAKINRGSVFQAGDEGEEPEEIDVSGNKVPEIPRHFAHLTVGVAHAAGWDLSASYTYRGAFFTDEVNTAFGAAEEGEDGEVPGVWLLSARASMKLADTGATIFIHGENLTDKLYISDREDGIKPGQGRTIWGGLKYKF
ncbi:MAG: TonB-dependent receptor [Hyphomicrobium sp.]